MDDINICAVIPAYNAENSVKQVVEEIREINRINYIVVVNDGSTDNTDDIVKKLDVQYIKQESNRGKGAALCAGFKRALSLNTEIIVTIDADYQHKTKEMFQLISKLLEEKLDIVIGARQLNINKMPVLRVLSNRITSKLISWRVGQNIIDSQSGYRAIRAEILKNIKLRSNRFEMESELLIKAILGGYKIGFTKIETIYNKNQSSSMRFCDIFRFVKIYGMSLFWPRIN